jgi:alkyl hydroperoxide reductase subunit AhpC
MQKFFGSTRLALRRFSSVSMSFPRIQHPAPAFTCQALMPNKEFKEISLSDYKGKYVVLFFYPLDFTFVCPTEIIAFSDRSSEFDAINTQVIAASCDSHFSVCFADVVVCILMLKL